MTIVWDPNGYGTCSGDVKIFVNNTFYFIKYSKNVLGYLIKFKNYKINRKSYEVKKSFLGRVYIIRFLF